MELEAGSIDRAHGTRLSAEAFRLPIDLRSVGRWQSRLTSRTRG